MKLSIQNETLMKYFGMEDTYAMIREAGFEAIDWDTCSSWDFDEVKKAKELKNLPRRFARTLPRRWRSSAKTA